MYFRPDAKYYPLSDSDFRAVMRAEGWSVKFEALENACLYILWQGKSASEPLRLTRGRVRLTAWPDYLLYIVNKLKHSKKTQRGMIMRRAFTYRRFE